eukprot:g6610.t1
MAVTEEKELRVALIGNVDAGKSTLVGVLSRGALDDGRGSARAAVFSHAHERETGRTSDVGRELLGFDGDGRQVGVQPAGARPLSERARWARIMERCGGGGRIVSLIDLAGHERYLKTTIFGMTALRPDVAICIVGANTGSVENMTKEHVGVALALQVPIVVCITKIDMAPPQIMRETREAIRRLLRGAGRTAVVVPRGGAGAAGGAGGCAGGAHA